MQAQIKLGEIRGIKIGLHYSWLIIAVLIALSLANYFSGSYPDWSSAVIWTMSIATVLLFFLAIVLHELSHAAVARSRDLPVRSITLFALGGVAQIEEESPDPKTEFWLGIIGPITSALIGLICLALAWILGWALWSQADTPLMAMLVWLGYVNIALAIFNMIPGFPMDGGRVMRAIVWKITGNAAKATRIASITGQFLAFVFIVGGLLLFFRGAGFGGLWIAFIGWFLLNAAKASYVQVELSEGLKGVTVGDLMSREFRILDGTVNLQTIVDEHLLKTGQRCFMIEENQSLAGLITPHEIKTFERRLWPMTTASDAMRPFEQLHAVAPGMPAFEAFEMMGREGVNQLPVVFNRQAVGMISREQVVNYLYARRELEV